LFKCFLYGLAGFAVLGLAIAGWVVFWPYSLYALGGVVFVGICIGLGSDLRSSRKCHGRGAGR
jgi:hypothetical protein